jgi:hypothetical protein
MSSINHYCKSFSQLTNSITGSCSVPYIAGTNKDLHEALEIPITNAQGVDEQKIKSSEVFCVIKGGLRKY